MENKFLFFHSHSPLKVKIEKNSIDTKRDNNFYCADYYESFASFFVCDTMR